MSGAAASTWRGATGSPPRSGPLHRPPPTPPVAPRQAASPLRAALEQGQNGEPTSPLAGPHAAAVLGDAAVAVPLRWRGGLPGILLIGAGATGDPARAQG